MKNYTITVNGNVYDVTVEEKGGSASTAAPVAAATPVRKAAPAASTGAGSIKIEAGAAGKVFKIEASAGTKVKTGDTIVVLEVMKMETPVVAPKDGVVASIDVSEGQTVEAGALLATMNE
ncbi:MAG: biotin/lipoyl-binding protein [Lachnospiraceae bacterium]|nr:biotin/lipoyl-binding protein [Lachnospiraceae bacterium]